MILDLPPDPAFLRPREELRPRRLGENLLLRFARAFPEISYDMLWETDTCNAQAFQLHGMRHVRVYGGLVRHRHVGLAGLAFAVAHETGHHLGGPPFHDYYPWLSSEDRADAWAAGEGLAAVFGPANGRRYAAAGQRQLSRAYRTMIL